MKKIRKVDKEDFNQLVKLLYELTCYERELLGIPLPHVNEVESRINLDFIYKNDLEYFVYEIENEIVGVIKIEKFHNESKISEAYVKKEHRNKGVMTKLYDKCIEWAKENETDEIYLTIVENNEIAYNYWTGLGFYKAELKNKLITLRKKVNEDIVK